MISPPNPSIHTAVAVLNEALAADRVAITNLVGHRVNCNGALADHPTVQVQCRSEAPNIPDWQEACVGLLGILNGVLEPMTGKRVAAVYDDNGQEIVEFRVYDPEETITEAASQ